MATTRPFRFGMLAENVHSREELLTTARNTEQAGYATFLIRDHLVEEPFGHQLAPLTTLSMVAAATNTLRVGSMVFDNDYRPPVMLAKEVATLDMLSGGRFELGLGAGFLKAEYDHAGIPFDAPGVRVDRFEEALRVLKGCFAEAPLTYSGNHYTVSNFDSFPKPVQRPHPPIMVGAAGRRMLSIAARDADIIGLLTVSTNNGVLSEGPTGRLAESVARQIEWIRQAAADRFREIELSLMCSVVITDHRYRAAEELAVRRGWSGISTEQVLEMPSIFIGSVEEIIHDMQERRERYGISYYVIRDSAMELVSPIVAKLAGK